MSSYRILLAALSVMLLCGHVGAQTAQTIQFELETPYVDRVMGATTRVVPAINLLSAAPSLFRVGALTAYFVYNTAEKTIDTNFPLLKAFKELLGGPEKLHIPREEKKYEKVEQSDKGLSGVLKPFKSIIKIEGPETLIKLSLASLFKDHLVSDAKEFKGWVSAQLDVIREELCGTYKIAEGKPLSAKERFLYIHYLMKRTQCKHHATIYEDILHEMTEGCTSAEINRIVNECVHYDEQALNQAAAYYGGMILMHKLLYPQEKVCAMICPVNCAPEGEIKVGKLVCHASAPLLCRTTPECRIHESMIHIAGKIAADLTKTPLSTMLRNEGTKKMISALNECGETEKGRKSLSEKIEAEVRKTLEEHRQELDAIMLILKKEWCINNSILDELLFPTQA